MPEQRAKHRHNMRFLKTQKERFQQPHDAFLQYLVKIASESTCFRHLQDEWIQMAIERPRTGESWSIWVGHDLFQNFVTLRDGFGQLTNVQCLEMMLLIHAQLDGLGLCLSFSHFRIQQPSAIKHPNLDSRRHSIKVPMDLKQYFKSPFDVELSSLLQIASPLTHLDFPNRELGLYLSNAPKGKPWTIWVSAHLKSAFLALKQKLSPSTSHGEFLYLLLKLNERQHKM